MVLIGHTEQIKGFHNFKCYFHQYPALFQGGHLAVIFFFVLSGFLITHIIKVKLDVNRFSVADFYKKRVVRIWPLYYLIVVLGLCVLPQLDFMAHNSEYVDSLSELPQHELAWAALFFLTVLPNISLFFGVFEYLGHTWSIGVEEQFYLVWPLLMKWQRKQPMLLLLGVVIFVWTVRFVSNELGLTLLNGFISVFKIDAMALGGVSAIIIMDHPRIKAYLVNIWCERIALILISAFYFSNTHFGAATDEVYAMLFSLIIVNAAVNPRTLVRLEWCKPLGYLGQVSYGLYMYHPITSMSALLLFQLIRPSYMASLSSNLAFYALAFGLTILIAVLSYELFEKRIMRWGRARWLSNSGWD